MSADPVDLEALASDHLDGELVGTAWREAQATHGAALDAALQAEQRRRAAVATLPTSALPPALRETIMDRVRATTVGAHDEADVTTTDATEDDAGDGAAAEPIQGPRWWWMAAPALLAALLLIAAWPLLRDDPGLSPEADRVASAPEPRTMTDDQAASESMELAAAEEAPASEPEFLFDEAAELADDHAANSLDGEPLARAGPQAQRRAAGQRATAAPAAAPAPMDAGASAPAMAKAADAPATAPDAEQAESEAEISDEAFDTLLAEAKDFNQREGAERQLEQAPPPPAEVTRDALAMEVGRRGGGVEADGAQQAAPTESGGAFADADQAAPSLALGITMGLIPADQADGVPELDILLVNRSPREVTGLGDLLQLQGLDGEGAVVWRTPAPAPAGAVIEPGGRLRWRLPLDGDRLPPAGVDALRLASGERVGEALPLMPAPPAAAEVAPTEER